MGLEPSQVRRVGISVRTRGVQLHRESVRRLVRHCLEAENGEVGRGLDVVLCGDRVMRRLNREFRQKDRTTDVLSFSDPEGVPLPPDVPASPLGEVVVSLPECRRQAADRDIDSGVELVRLIIHGTLHVLGFDHEIEVDRKCMEPRERQLRAWARTAQIGPQLLAFPEAEV